MWPSSASLWTGAGSSAGHSSGACSWVATNSMIALLCSLAGTNMIRHQEHPRMLITAICPTSARPSTGSGRAVRALRRQLNRERRAHAGRALGGDGAAVRLGDPARDRQPQPRAPRLPRARLVHAVEAVEDAG